MPENNYPPNQQWPDKGTKLRAKSVLPTIVYPHFISIVKDAHDLLVPETEYTVEKCEVYSSWCSIWLKEFPNNNIRFHLSFFEWEYNKKCSIEEMNQWREKAYNKF